MYSKLRTALAQFIRLNDDEFRYFVSRLSVTQVLAKELWQLEGVIGSKIAFVNKGLLRHYYNKDGEEVTAQFYFETDWVGDLMSHLIQEPSKMNIQALETTELFVLFIEDIQDLFIRIPALEKFDRLYSQRVAIQLYHREYSFLVDSPEERYLKLLQEKPNLVERIPQYYLAQYLGIRPESLSRIRKRLARRD